MFFVFLRCACCCLNPMHASHSHKLFFWEKIIFGYDYDMVNVRIVCNLDRFISHCLILSQSKGHIILFLNFMNTKCGHPRTH